MLIQRKNNSFYAYKHRFTCMVKLWFILSCIGFHSNWIQILNSKEVCIHCWSTLLCIVNTFDMHCWSDFHGLQRRQRSFPYVVFIFLDEMSKTMSFYVTLAGFQYFLDWVSMHVVWVGTIMDSPHLVDSVLYISMHCISINCTFP
jgi:hypothetical protein